MSAAPYVRAMETGEHELWAQLRLRLWPETSADENAEDINAYSSGGSIKVVMLAFDETDTPIGFAEISERSVVDGCGHDPAAYLEGWYVDENRRGKGVGAQMIKAAADWARASGYEFMGSDVELDNEVSQKAHQALGFESCGEVVRYRMRVNA